MNDRTWTWSRSLSRVLTWCLLLPLHAYRLTISRIMPNVCRFRPTCSEYMLDALLIHGPIKGLALGTWRLLRCQPFAKSGFDPVPCKHRH
ncbi:MAG: membrane protein insertion efficiency factor YidD [Planctomycetota bacterium]